MFKEDDELPADELQATIGAKVKWDTQVAEEVPEVPNRHGRGHIYTTGHDDRPARQSVSDYKEGPSCSREVSQH